MFSSMILAQHHPKISQYFFKNRDLGNYVDSNHQRIPQCIQHCGCGIHMLVQFLCPYMVHFLYLYSALFSYHVCKHPKPITLNCAHCVH